jgi:drug/metabolite transporter (DMT)-like permease
MRKAYDDGVFLCILINMTVFVILIPILHISDRLPALTLYGFFLFAIAGLLTTFGGRAFHFAAIRKIGPSRAVPFRSSSLLFTICLAYLFLAERLSIPDFVGAGAIVGGVWFLSREVSARSDLSVTRKSWPNDTIPPVENRSSNRYQHSFIGILFGIFSAISFGTGHFLRKLAMIEVPSPYWGVAIGSVAGFLAIVLQAALKGELTHIWRYNLNLKSPPWSFISAGILTTVGQLFCYLAIYYTSVSIAMVLISSEPLGTVIISRLFLGAEEALNWRVYLSALTVFGGIALIFLL